MRRPPAPRCPRPRGFTLVEMLVTLAIFATVSTLLWQALAQAARVELQLADSRRWGEREALQRAWVREAIAGLATAPSSDPLKFTGGPTRLEGYATMPPWPLASGLEHLVLELELDPAARSTRLLASAPGRVALALWTWPGTGRFEYLSADGRWQPRWTANDGALPRAVRLVGPPDGGLWVSVASRQTPIVSRRDLPVEVGP